VTTKDENNNPDIPSVMKSTVSPRRLISNAIVAPRNADDLEM
jgi:hypothetical protein